MHEAGYIYVAIKDMPVGQEFLWGAYNFKDMNLGRKKSSRTIEYKPLILGKLSDTWDWSYFGKHEGGWIKSN
jgi:hypothetical protein